MDNMKKWLVMLGLLITEVSAAPNLHDPNTLSGNATSTNPAQALVDMLNNNKGTTPEASPATNSPDDPNRLQKLAELPENKAYNDVVKQIFPMTPEQIKALNKTYSASQYAAATTPGVPPRPMSSCLPVDLTPGATPPVVRLAAGTVTSLVMVDNTGKEWPIASFSIGDPTAFNVQWDQKSNILLVQSQTNYKRSNIAIILQGLNLPIMVTLISGQGELDYLVELQVPKFGPNAAPNYQGLPAKANASLLEILNGVPPQGSKYVKINSTSPNSAKSCQAWLYNGDLYLRTKLDLLSPGWKAVVHSGDGTHVYQLTPTPVILALQQGTERKISLELEGM